MTFLSRTKGPTSGPSPMEVAAMKPTHRLRTMLGVLLTTGLVLGGTSLAWAQLPGPPDPFKDRKEVGPKVVPVPSGCTYRISSTSHSIGAGGGLGSVTVTAPSGCRWTVDSNVNWIGLTLASAGYRGSGGPALSGSGNDIVGYSVSANTSSSSRTGTLTIAGQSFTITQPICTYSASISPASQLFGPSGGRGSVTVTFPSGCPLPGEPMSSVSWITVVRPGTAFAMTREYTVADNLSGSDTREGKLITAGQTFIIGQTGCTYSLSATSHSVGAGGGPASVTVTAPSDCYRVTANLETYSNVPWVSITSGSRYGTGPVNYSVMANTSPSARTGTLTIRGTTSTMTHTMTQAASTEACTYSISPTSQPFSYGGGTGNVRVTTASGCSWMATSSAWITITSGGSGTGPGTVNYSVAANVPSDHGRGGALTIAGQIVTVNQGADPTCNAPNYSISPVSASVPASGGGGTVTVTAPAPYCTWARPNSQPTGISITSISAARINENVFRHSGTVSYSVAPNTSRQSRTLSVEIANRRFTVTQAGSP